MKQNILIAILGAILGCLIVLSIGALVKTEQLRQRIKRLQPARVTMQSGTGICGWVTIKDITDYMQKFPNVKNWETTPYRALATEYPKGLLDKRIKDARQYRIDNPDSVRWLMVLDDSTLHNVPIRIMLVDSIIAGGKGSWAGCYCPWGLRAEFSLLLTDKTGVVYTHEVARHPLQRLSGYAPVKESYVIDGQVIGYLVEEEPRLGQLLPLAMHYDIPITAKNMEELLWAMVNDSFAHYYRNGRDIKNWNAYAPGNEWQLWEEYFESITSFDDYLHRDGWQHWSSYADDLRKFRYACRNYFEQIQRLSDEERQRYIHEKALALPGLI